MMSDLLFVVRDDTTRTERKGVQCGTTFFSAPPPSALFTLSP